MNFTMADEMSLILDNPPLTAISLYEYMRGADVLLNGKKVLFLQLEFYSQLKTNKTKSLKEICRNLWDLTTVDQRRTFESIAHKFNEINRKRRRRHRCLRHITNRNGINELPNCIAFDPMNGSSFP